jgi:uncharacterized protein
MRLVEGRWGWWCVTATGVALVPAELVHDGTLTADGAAALADAGLRETGPTRHYSLTVVTASGCNLGCPYCFQNTAPAAPGRFAPPRIPVYTMDNRTIGALVVFTRKRMATLGVDRLHVLLFGGEPLLHPRGCVEVLTRCAALGHLTAGIVTNGVLLRRPLARQLAAAGLGAVQVTLDGPAEVHDRLRTTRAGRGTYHGIVANVAAAQAATDLRFTLRLNVTPPALAGLTRLLDGLAGALDARRCGLGLAPVLDYDSGFRGHLRPTEGARRAILDAYAHAHDLGFRIARPGDGRCDFCSREPGSHGAVVNADGTLYSCWDSIGRAGFALGSVHTGYTTYSTDRWVRCAGQPAQAPPSPNPASAMRRFTDEIDAGLLDLMRQWRAGTAPARRQ